MNKHALIYKIIADILNKEQKARTGTINEASERLARSSRSRGITPDLNEIRARVGAVFNEMLEFGVITPIGEGYGMTCDKPVAIRVELCEKEILSLLKSGNYTKYEIRTRLEEKFGTRRTPSLKDDNILFSFIGQILKRLVRFGVIGLNDGLYHLKEEKRAKLDDIESMLAVKGEFLTRLHAKGGEFFEHYFMTLIGKYLSKHGRTILENYTTGGTADGGIDGVIKTLDSLGFRETIMVQTKNRFESTNETAVRSFYGAVCAKNGSRGLFATTSDFHPSAIAFLDGIDNCVGVDGTKLFDMARECRYGIKKKRGSLIVDKNLL